MVAPGTESALLMAAADGNVGFPGPDDDDMLGDEVAVEDWRQMKTTLVFYFAFSDQGCDLWDSDTVKVFG